MRPAPRLQAPAGNRFDGLADRVRAGAVAASKSGGGKSIGDHFNFWGAGILKQIGNETAQLPRGIFELAKGVGYLQVGVGRAAVDVARHQGLSPGENDDGSFFDQRSGDVRHYTPLIADVSTSVKDSADRVTGINPLTAAARDLALRRQPGTTTRAALAEYQQASDENRLVNMFAEDIGNVSIVASGAAGLLGKAGGVARAVPGRVAAADAAGTGLRSVGAAGAEAAVRTSPRSLLYRSVKAGERSPVESTLRVAGRQGGELGTTVSKGRGLAGLASKAGKQGLAEGLEAMGTTARKIGLGAEMLDPTTPTFAVAGRVARKGLAKAGERGVARAQRWTDNLEVRETAHNFRGSMQQVIVEIQRSAIDAAQTAAGRKLSTPEERAVLNAVDQRFDAVTDTVTTMVDAGRVAEAERVLAKAQADLPGGDLYRLTLDDIAEYDRYRKGRLDPANRDANAAIIDDLRDRVEGQASDRRNTRQHLLEQTGRSMDEDLAPARVEYRTADGVVRRELTGQELDLLRADPTGFGDFLATLGDDVRVLRPEFKASVIEARQGPLLAKVDMLNSQIDRQRETVARLSKRADVREAAQIYLPDPGGTIDPTVTLDAAAGRAKAARAKLDGLLDELEPLQAKLESLLDEQRTGDGPDLRAEDQIAEMLQDVVDKSNEIDVLLDEQRALSINDELPFSQEAERILAEKPEPTGMVDVDALRAEAKAMVNEEIRLAYAEFDDLTGGSKVREPAPPDVADSIDRDRNGWWSLGNESPAMRPGPGRERFWKRLSEYKKKGWINDWNDTGLTMGQMVDDIKSRHERFRDLDDNAVIGAYFDAIDAILEVEQRADAWQKSPRIAEKLAASSGLDIDSVELALRNKKEFEAKKRVEANGALDEIVERIAGSDEVFFDAFRAEWEARRAEGGDVAGWLIEYLSSPNSLDDVGSPMSEAYAGELVYKFDVPELEAWIEQSLLDDRPADTGSLIDESVAGMSDQIEGMIAAAREQRAGMQAEVDALIAAKRARDRAGLKATDQAAKAERAGLEVRRADGSSQTDRPWERQGPASRLVTDQVLDPVNGPRDPLPGETPRPYREANRSALSQAEREQAAAVRARTYATIEANRLAQLERQRSRYRQRAADLERSLDRSTQERMVSQSDRTIRSTQAAVRSSLGATERLGKVELGMSGDKPFVSGVMGKIARKLGFEELVVSRLEEISEAGGFDDAMGMTRADVTGAAFLDAYESSGTRMDPGDWDTFQRTLLAEDLSEIADQYTSRHGVDHLAVHKMSKALNERIAEYDRANAVRNAPGGSITDLAGRGLRASENLKLDIDQQLRAFQKSRFEMLERVNDVHTAAMPSRFRAPAINSRRVVRALMELADEALLNGNPELADWYAGHVDSVATSMQMLVDQGVIDPVHLTGGGPVESAPGGGARGRRGAGPVRGTRQLKGGGRVLDLAEYAKVEANEMTNLILGKGLEDLANDPNFSKTFQDLPQELKDQTRADGRWVTRDAYDRILKDAGYERVRSGGNLAERGREFEGPGSMRAMDTPDRGTMPGAGEVNPLRPARPAYFDDRLMPSKLLDEMDELRGGTNKWLLLYDQVLQSWKTPVLAMSVKWLTDNIAGGAMMGTAGAGISPTTLIRELDKARKQSKRAAGGRGMMRRAWGGSDNLLPPSAPDQLGSHGLTHNERRLASRISDSETRMGGVLAQMSDSSRSRIGVGDVNLGRVVENSYNLNEMTDNLFRTAVYTKELMDRAPKIPDELMVNGQFRTELLVTRETLVDVLEQAPEGSAQRASYQAQLDYRDRHIAEYDRVKKAVAEADEKATAKALVTLGDFTRMSSVERKLVRRVIPFYAWLRHQTQAAVRIPLSSPQRAAWFSGMYDVLTDDDEMGWREREMFGMSVDTPWGNVNLASMNPYVALSGIAFDPTNPEPTMRGLSPLIKLPVQHTTGFDLANMDIASRKPSDLAENMYGSRETTPTLSLLREGRFGKALGEVGYSLANMTPQTRGLRELATGRGQARYDSGDRIVDKNGTPLYDRDVSLAEMWAKILRAPLVPRNVDEQRAKLRALDKMNG